MLVTTMRRNRIGGLLTDQGRSIYWLAKAVDMSYQAIHALVNSPQIPPGTDWITLRKVADALDVPVDDLEESDE